MTLISAPLEKEHSRNIWNEQLLECFRMRPGSPGSDDSLGSEGGVEALILIWMTMCRIVDVTVNVAA